MVAGSRAEDRYRILDDGRTLQRMSVDALEPDAVEAQLASIDVTLSSTPGDVTVVTLPTWARGFRLYPYTNAARFAIDEDPEETATDGTAAVAAAAFAVGALAQPDQWEVRLLETEGDHALHLLSPSASTVVTVEVF